MNIFKNWITRNPKRSEWMEGLLWAEECKVVGWSDSWVWVLRLESHRKGDNFDHGVSDYLHHDFHTLQPLKEKQE